METPSKVELTHMLASRINHDYVTPLTAIINSIELIQIAPENTDECIELIAQSAQNAVALLQYYRVAYGGYEADETVPISQAIKRLTDYAGEEQIQVVMDVDGHQLLKSDAKLIFLTLLCARAGFVHIHQFGVSGRTGDWRIVIEGEGLKGNDPENLLGDEWRVAKPNSNRIPFMVLDMSLEALGYDYSAETEGDGIIIRLVKSGI